MDETTELTRGELDRRTLIRRTAVLGAATAWATPTVQSIAGPAFAAGSPQGACNSCLTGGGNDVGGGTFNGTTLDSITVGVGQLCCGDAAAPGNAEPQIQVTLHPVGGSPRDDTSFHFDTLVSLTCSSNGQNPAPPPNTENCSNVFNGVATDGEGNTLTFQFEDNGGAVPGEAGGESGEVDFMSIQITGPGVSASGMGNLTKGNLQVHAGLGPMEHDCSGC